MARPCDDHGQRGAARLSRRASLYLFVDDADAAWHRRCPWCDADHQVGDRTMATARAVSDDAWGNTWWVSQRLSGGGGYAFD